MIIRIGFVNRIPIARILWRSAFARMFKSFLERFGYEFFVFFFSMAILSIMRRGTFRAASKWRLTINSLRNSALYWGALAIFGNCENFVSNFRRFGYSNRNLQTAVNFWLNLSIFKMNVRFWIFIIFVGYTHFWLAAKSMRWEKWEKRRGITILLRFGSRMARIGILYSRVKL